MKKDEQALARSKILEDYVGWSAREFIRGSMWWIALAFVLLIVGLMLVKPSPPKKVVIAAGPRDGAYYYFAQQYAKTFAENGVTLEVRETAGTVENYKLLASGEASLAICQGGAAPQGLKADLGSIASLYLEPVWVFHRGGEDEQIADLRGKRVAIGGEGSGTRAIALQLLAANGIREGAAATAPAPPRAPPASTLPATTQAAPPGDPDGPPAPGPTTLLPFTGRRAADALLRGEIDAAFFVIGPNSPIVHDLLKSDRVTLMSVQRHEAYARLFPYLSSAKLPRGVVDLSRGLPAEDAFLVAPAANLVIREDLHPTLIPLVARAAFAAHERGDLLSRPGEFPSAQFVEYPLDPAAREYFRSGPPFLQRYLPFWVAAWVDRMKILLLPLIALLIPLMRIGPPLYVWRIRSRIYRWYRVIRELDHETRRAAAGQAKRSLEGDLAALGALEKELELASERVPLSYMQEFYNLRLHADYIRRRLEARGKLEQNSESEK